MNYVECLARFYSSFHIYRHTRFKFHDEFVLVDGDFFNQPPDKRLVIFDQGGGLFPKEGTHVGDALFLFILPGDFQLLLLLKNDISIG